MGSGVGHRFRRFQVKLHFQVPEKQGLRIWGSGLRLRHHVRRFHVKLHLKLRCPWVAVCIPWANRSASPATRWQHSTQNCNRPHETDLERRTNEVAIWALRRAVCHRNAAPCSMHIRFDLATIPAVLPDWTCPSTTSPWCLSCNAPLQTRCPSAPATTKVRWPSSRRVSSRRRWVRPVRWGYRRCGHAPCRRDLWRVSTVQSPTMFARRWSLCWWGIASVCVPWWLLSTVAWSSSSVALPRVDGFPKRRWTDLECPMNRVCLPEWRSERVCPMISPSSMLSLHTRWDIRKPLSISSHFRQLPLHNKHSARYLNHHSILIIMVFRLIRLCKLSKGKGDFRSQQLRNPSPDSETKFELYNYLQDRTLHAQFQGDAIRQRGWSAHIASLSLVKFVHHASSLRPKITSLQQSAENITACTVVQSVV